LIDAVVACNLPHIYLQSNDSSLFADWLSVRSYRLSPRIVSKLAGIVERIRSEHIPSVEDCVEMTKIECDAVACLIKTRHALSSLEKLGCDVKYIRDFFKVHIISIRSICRDI